MNKINQKGYALLFTVVIISMISLLTVGLANTTLKQLVLSLGAKDSQMAFFQSDMAVECALYAETRGNMLINNNTFNCGVGKNASPYQLKVISTESGKYSLSVPSLDTSSDPCFRISIIQEIVANVMTTRILASGYNICDKTNARTVERTVEINY